MTLGVSLPAASNFNLNDYSMFDLGLGSINNLSAAPGLGLGSGLMPFDSLPGAGMYLGFNPQYQKYAYQADMAGRGYSIKSSKGVSIVKNHAIDVLNSIKDNAAENTIKNFNKLLESMNNSEMYKDLTDDEKKAYAVEVMEGILAEHNEKDLRSFIDENLDGTLFKYTKFNPFETQNYSNEDIKELFYNSNVKDNMSGLKKAAGTAAKGLLSGGAVIAAGKLIASGKLAGLGGAIGAALGFIGAPLLILGACAAGLIMYNSWNSSK